MKNAGYIYDKYIYNRLRLSGVIINFQYNNCDSANVIETKAGTINRIID